MSSESLGPKAKVKEDSELSKEEKLSRVQEDYEAFLQTHTFKFPSWLYGPVKGKLLKVEIEDCPNFGDKAFVEFDSARTAIIVVDMQIDFCGKNGYVDVMGYDLSLTAGPIKPIKNILDTVRDRTDIKVIHTREGHMPNLADLPYNKLLRSKIIGKGVGIGDKPDGGEGQLLVRGQKNWNIVDELVPMDGEYVIDKSAKGAFAHSDFGVTLKKLGITHLIMMGITTDVCVHTIIREANDIGYWCILLKDCTGATNQENYEAAIKQIKMQGGVFGWVSDSNKFINAIKDGFNV